VSGVAPARRCAYRVVRRVHADGAFADRAFRAEADRIGLDARDRALAQRLAYGTVQRRATLDALLAAVSSRPPEAIDPAVLDALRLGVHQLVHLEGIPDHAAVAETVELVKGEVPRAAGFANAVLRRAAREAPALAARLPDDTPAAAAVAHSHPEWVVRLWWDLLGPDEARALLARDNEPPESALRVNALRASPAAVAAELEAAGVQARGDERLPEALVLGAPFDVHGSRLFADGLVMPQSRSSMLVARTLAPRAGERVLDLCAAPGAKTTHLAALMGGEGRVVALERHPGRAQALAENVARLGAERVVEVRAADAAEPQPDAPFDRVVLDPPCSDLGTLQARPDVRWRKTPETVAELGALQRRLLGVATEAVRPGGVLVYSTCTISPEENERQVERLLAERDDLEADDLGAVLPDLAHPRAPRFLQILPHRHGSDGFFVARLHKRGG
jgi:16S rRNA (cytosine967-C5)-methyltransferase